MQLVRALGRKLDDGSLDELDAHHQRHLARPNSPMIRPQRVAEAYQRLARRRTVPRLPRLTRRDSLPEVLEGIAGGQGGEDQDQARRR